jgi:hypothetical protein
MLMASTGNALSFEKYYELLTSAATHFEANLARKPKHMVYTHETTGYPREDDFEEHVQELYDQSEEPYDIDRPVTKWKHI